MSNVIEIGPNVYQSLGVPLSDYNTISRGSHWNIFCKKDVLDISSKTFQKYLWLSSFIVKLQAFSLQLYYQNIFFPEQVFLGHSWQRIPNTLPMLWRPPNIPYPTFLKFCPTHLPCCLQPSPPLLFLINCFFEWMADCATFDVLFHLMILWI